MSKVWDRVESHCAVQRAAVGGNIVKCTGILWGPDLREIEFLPGGSMINGHRSYGYDFAPWNSVYGYAEEDFKLEVIPGKQVTTLKMWRSLEPGHPSEKNRIPIMELNVHTRDILQEPRLTFATVPSAAA